LWWPLLLCRALANGFHPTTHKVSLQTSKAIILPKTRASCYSHHLSQYALRETNWLFRVSRCKSLLESLLYYIMRHHHKPSWNYVLTMRHHHKPSLNYVLTMSHHHELPLTGVMKLRSDHEAPPRNLRWITSWPWGTTMKPSWNYILTIPKIMSHKSGTKLSCIPIPCQYITNHFIMFHMCNHTKSINSKPHKHIMHTYWHVSYFN